MERDEEIQQRGKKIQFQINKLKKLNCSIDSRYNSICIFDNSIDPEIIVRDGDTNYKDYIDQIVFDFNT